MWRMILPALSDLGVKVMAAEPKKRAVGFRRPDVWMIDGHQGPLDVAAPVVAHLQEAPWLEPEAVHQLNPEFAEACRRNSQAAADQAAMVITPSEFARQQVISTHGIDPGHVRAVHLGVDQTVFYPARRAEGEALVVRRRGTVPYVVFVSTVHPRKNLPALRDAMTQLARDGFPHSLVLVISPAPDRPDSSQLEAEAMSQLPGFPGRVTTLRGLSEAEVAAVIAGADALCAPSFSEGFGLPVLEAMACGTPVVASERGALPEVVGMAGLVVSPDPESIAGGLRTLLSNAAYGTDLSKAGLVRSSELTWPAAARAWLACLEEAVG